MHYQKRHLSDQELLEVLLRMLCSMDQPSSQPDLLLCIITTLIR